MKPKRLCVPGHPRMKFETVDGHRLSVWSNPECPLDDVTVVDLDYVFLHPAHGGEEYVNYWSKCGHGEMPLRAVAHRGRGGPFAKRITFAELPLWIQNTVRAGWAQEAEDDKA